MQVLAQYLPDLFTPIAQRMAVLCNFPIYYDWGHQPEIAQKLSNLDKGKSSKSQKYPLMWLVMDFKEAKGANMDVYTKTSLSFVIARIRYRSDIYRMPAPGTGSLFLADAAADVPSVFTSAE